MEGLSFYSPIFYVGDGVANRLETLRRNIDNVWVTLEKPKGEGEIPVTNLSTADDYIG